MATQGDMLRNKAIELLKNNPNGLRYYELVRELHGIFPSVPDSIRNAIWDLDVKRNREVHKPTRGLFKYRVSGEEEIIEVEKPPPSVQEEDFYEPFASYLRHDLGECTEAIPLGGNYLGKKWGTPDVVGVYKPARRAIIPFQTEIISAEIKINPSEPITAFGQAIAYRLFSSKVYLVEPITMSKEDQDRVEALCVLFGIGLILFDLNPENPNFNIRVRAQRYNPDMFYVNEFANKLESARRDVFERLF